MRQGKTHSSCRYWGYEPVKPDGFGGGDWQQQSAKRAEYKAIRDKVKEAGYKATEYGLRSVDEAIRKARTIEDHTGVEMEVFNHDYL